MHLTKTKRVAAAVVIKDKTILLARRRQEDVMPGFWEFPGGKIQPEETPEKCLEREFLEEFQMKIEVGAFIGRNIHHYPHATIELLAYWAKPLTEPKILRAHDQIQWLSPKQASSLNFSPADIPILELVEQKWKTHF